MVIANNIVEKLLNEHDVARITGLSVASVRRWRLLKQGPRYLKIGAAVRYKAEDIAKWLETRPTGGEHPPESR
jgi:predicted DNA-binding transcriptional regulator AlpA